MSRSLGADSTAVYLAEDWTDQELPTLVPVATYPQATHWSAAQPATRDRRWTALPTSENSPEVAPEVESSEASSKQTAFDPSADVGPAMTVAQTGKPSYQHVLQSTANAEEQDYRAVLPLIHEGVVMGVLVSWRRDRPWYTTEHHQLEEFAQTLALACVLDQRGQWLTSRLESRHRSQQQQSERFHELLHQLRNPLTALRTFGKLLLRRLDPDNKNRSLASGIVRESDRMQELLGYFDDTLKSVDAEIAAESTTPSLLPPSNAPLPATSAASTTTITQHFGGTLKCQSCDLPSLLSPLLESAVPLAEERQRTLLPQPFPKQVPPVWADPNALREVVSNLLENALKYTPTHALIWVQIGLSSYLEASQPCFQGILVGDTGPGIPGPDQPHIFERHYRGVQAQGDVGGTGLGLAIVADLVAEMQGTIEVYSPLSECPWPLPDAVPQAAADHGTAFVVWLQEAHPVNSAS